MKLNLGCGSQVPDGWVNVDYALGARFAKIPLFGFINRKLNLFNMEWDDRIVLHDLTKRFPWNDDSADIIYSSHTLEHFTRDAGRTFLQECYRVLRKDGTIRIVVPDLAHIVEEYRAGKLESDYFLDNLGVLYSNHGGRLKHWMAPFIQFPHRCMFDTPTLLKVLDQLGFDVSSKPAFESDAIEDIQMIELQGRTDHAVIVEGRKR